MPAPSLSVVVAPVPKYALCGSAVMAEACAKEYIRPVNRSGTDGLSVLWPAQLQPNSPKPVVPVLAVAHRDGAGRRPC